MVLKFLSVVLVSCCLSSTAIPGEAPTTATDPLLEARVNKLAEELRCLVCQNQSLADSHAELAIDLKNQVREMLEKGMSNQQVVDYLVQRYGDFVLYRPPVKGTTWLLWSGPFLLLVIALAFFVVKLRRHQRLEAEPLSAEEHATADLLLRNKGKQ